MQVSLKQLRIAQKQFFAKAPNLTVLVLKWSYYSIPDMPLPVSALVLVHIQYQFLSVYFWK